MGSWTGSIMIIKIQCEDKKAIFLLYSDITYGMTTEAYQVSVNEYTLEVHIADDNLEKQKIVANQIKQFMRDNEINYKMEIK